MQENIIYQDKVKSSPMIIVGLSMSLVVILIVGLVLYLKQQITIDSSVLPTLLVVMAIDLIILVTFKQMQIVITDQVLKFGFCIFKKKIDLKKIEKAEIQEFKFSNYFGYGIRYGRDNTIGYVPCGGRGLKVKVKNEKREFFFICNRPEEALKFIRQYGAQK